MKFFKKREQIEFVSPPSRPMRIGYWKEVIFSHSAECSLCKREVVYQMINDRYEYENYCPHCGAYMLKENER